MQSGFWKHFILLWQLELLSPQSPLSLIVNIMFSAQVLSGAAAANEKPKFEQSDYSLDSGAGVVKEEVKGQDNLAPFAPSNTRRFV